MRFFKLSSLAVAVAASLLVGKVGLAQPPAAAGAAGASGKSASQSSSEARSQERAPAQHWDGLSPQVIKRVMERQAKAEVPAFQAEFK